MRLNKGLPVWHASMSLQMSGDRRLNDQNARLTAVRFGAVAMIDVGSERGEWWFWNKQAAVGHLRVPVTEEETKTCGVSLGTSDAGQAGTWRRRTLVPPDVLAALEPNS